ncbi:hypothetical protein HBH56_013340 [Parastagonospora nodorum]|uniref:Uncharacterized protein n=2 Tax=Phaeosphaeria nodorum (strain SN15 / ATCC MYA-4574 / FGSC 10173) TaxID=321614 RepID=A0A7U2I010_PHANO|nr:hypothetical protein SNOG_02605 [Parastagonospora nodorum SN15]KAH3919359.1 hypothetical protein HBH56_013340 [Parastagonospora nodorum]EAT89336.1 hypothetical protein SNOG_02605 [Parastagonospora nodorum SN15]KAH3937095.1 hypothetical protein HBH54_021100 [Parastagonospora nodorum]KAH3969248.1 hypothetical protein HBH51_125660 [Parastagonospora nodorum]KAH4100621.1 hypothetical protein HBH46_149170 [Parastagonospora nodorum]
MSQSQSRLLQLPAEIRNNVYDYLFKDPDKVIPHTGDTSNQLKLVCWQLYHETAWLEVRLNDILIMIQDSSEQPGPAQQLVTFHSRGYPIGSDRHLQTVVLKQNFINNSLIGRSFSKNPLEDPSGHIAPVSESHTTFLQLADICRASPQLKVRYILPGFFLDENRPDAALYFILQGVFYTCAIREGNDFKLLWNLPALAFAGANIAARANLWLRYQHCKTKVQLEMEVIRHRRGQYVQSLLGEEAEEEIRDFLARGGYQTIHRHVFERLRLPNLKFFPTCTKFDEAEFKRLLLNSASASPTAAAMLNDLVAQNLVDFWVTKARKWVEEGI